MAFKSYLLASSVALLWAGASHAVAQTNTRPVVNELDTVVVTAERKGVGQAIQTVPMAITAVDAQKIEDLHITDVSQLGRLAPSVQLDGAGSFPGYANFYIRGIGVTTSTRTVDPAVNIFQDGMVIAYQAGAILDTFDLESVQVLKGPQGVLFGRNSSAGAVILTTPLPSRDFHTAASVMVGNRSQFALKGKVEGPIVADRIFGKLSVTYDRHGPYLKNGNYGTFVPAPNNPSGLPPAVPKYGDLNSAKHLVIKPTFLIDINEDLSLRLYGQYLRNRDGGGGAQSYIPEGGPLSRQQTLFGYYPAPLKDFTTNVYDAGYTNIDAQHLVADLQWNVGGGTLTTVIAARKVTYNSTLNSDGSPFNLFHFKDNKERNTQQSFESRYNISVGKFDLLGGVYFLNSLTHVTERRRFNGSLLNLPYTTTQDQLSQFRQGVATGAVFANIDYRMTEQLRFSVGARYEGERKNLLVSPTRACAGVPYVGCVLNFGKTNENWTGFTPRVVVDYQATPDLLVYASYNKGVRAGNYNVRGSTLAIATTPTEPEDVDAFEVGVKSQWLDRRLRLNLSAYKNKFTDIQRTALGNINGVPVSTLVNAADATVKGFEFEGVAIPFSGLQLTTSVGYVDPKYTSIAGVTPNVPGTNPLDLVFDHVSEWTYNLGATYRFTAGMPGDFAAVVNYNHRSKTYMDLINTPQLIQPGYGLLDASLTYNQDNWRLSAFGRNITNKWYSVTLANVGLGWVAFPGSPRTFGLEFSIKN